MIGLHSLNALFVVGICNTLTAYPAALTPRDETLVWGSDRTCSPMIPWKSTPVETPLPTFESERIRLAWRMNIVYKRHLCNDLCGARCEEKSSRTRCCKTRPLYQKMTR